VKAKPRPDCILKVKALKQDAEGRIVGWEIAEKQEDVNMIWINQEDCIRCGACVAACPVDAISIQKVSLVTEPVT
jgi:NAD-dependent dihydropyrimidine dehydrogenase PreA subunit